MRIAQVMGGSRSARRISCARRWGKKDMEKWRPCARIHGRGAAAEDRREGGAGSVRHHGQIRGVRVQQGPCHRVCPCRLSMRVSQGALSDRVPHRQPLQRPFGPGRDIDNKERSGADGVKILPPDVNKSQFECSIDEGKIRLGLGTIKNVGKAAESVLDARKKKGKFTSLFEMCASVDLRLVNKSARIAVYAGALDCLQGTRAQLFASIDAAIDYGNSFQKDRQSGQTSLFDGGGNTAEESAPPEPAACQR